MRKIAKDINEVCIDAKIVLQQQKLTTAKNTNQSIFVAKSLGTDEKLTFTCGHNNKRKNDKSFGSQYV